MTVVWHEHPAAAATTRPPIRGMALCVLASLMLLTLAGALVYFSWTGWRTPALGERLRAVPIPVARLGTEIAWYGDVYLLACGLAVERGRDAPIAEDYDDALALGVRRLFVARLARELDVDVTDAEIEAEFVEDDALLSFLASAGWDLGDYKRLLLAPFVVEQQTELALYEEDDYQEGVRDDLQSILDKLEIGIAFEDVAAQYSEDESALAKGSLGYVLLSEVDEGFAPAFALAVGETSGVLETADALWIVRLEDIARDAENGDRYFLRGIAVKKRSLADVVDEIMKTKNAAVFVF